MAKLTGLTPLSLGCRETARQARWKFRVQRQLGGANRFVGEFDSDYDFVWQYLEDTSKLNAIPAHLQIYFDAEARLREQAYGGAFLYASVNYKVYIFFRTLVTRFPQVCSRSLGICT